MLDSRWDAYRLRIRARSDDCEPGWKRTLSTGQSPGCRACTSVFAGWPTDTLSHDLPEERFQFHLGDGRERKRGSPAFSQLEGIALSMLRKLVDERRLLLLPSGSPAPPNHLA